MAFSATYASSGTTDSWTPSKATPLRLSDSLETKLKENVAKHKCGVSAVLLDGKYTTTDFADCISIRDTLLSYLPKGKSGEAEALGREWKKKDRQAGKPAKVARALILPDYTLMYLNDAMFEKFANLIKGDVDGDTCEYGTFRIVSGEAIRHWYNAQHQAPSSFSSCMSYEKNQPWFDIYCKNTNIRMLVIINDNEQCVGRALLWTTTERDANGEPVVVMDRVYAKSGAETAFQNYADKKGWKRDAHYRYNSTDKFYTVQLENSIYKAYPYIDTFQFVDHKKKTLVNSQSEHRDESLGYNGGPHAAYTCWSCKQAWPNEGKDLVLNDQGAWCPTCLTKHTCARCKTFDKNQKNGICQACVALRTCAFCAEIQYSTDLTDGYCDRCAALGKAGRDEVVARRTEEERLRLERKAKAAELKAMREKNRTEFMTFLSAGPDNLQKTFALAYPPTQQVFLEHPVAAYDRLKPAELRKLIEEMNKEFVRIFQTEFKKIEAREIKARDLLGPRLDVRLAELGA